MSITINIKSNNGDREVVIPVEWKDITVKYWGELATIIKGHYDSASDKNKKEEKDENPILTQYEQIEHGKELNDVQSVKMNADIFAYITGLTEEEVALVDISQIEKVISTINELTEEYKPKGIKSFDFEGETYHFPSEFLKKETYGDFIESTQLNMYIKDMENGRFDILPEQMAILCRMSDEEYNDDAIPEKAEKFRELTMDIIWEFSFFLTQRTERLSKLFLMYSEKQQQAQGVE